jgi:DNA-binding transcriptional LysR family regulator
MRWFCYCRAIASTADRGAAFAACGSAGQFGKPGTGDEKPQNRSSLTIPQFVPTGLHSRRLFRERYVGVVRQKHSLAKGSIDVKRFIAFPHLLVSPDRGDFNGPTDAALDKIGLKRNIALVVPSFSVVAAIIDTTDLVAVLPSRLLGHVWTAPGWQGFSSRFAALVGAAMCSAC